MRRFYPVILFLLSASILYADEDYIEGRKYSLLEVAEWSGMGAPSLSPSGSGRIYFDSSSNLFKVSENGGAYANLVGGGSGAPTDADYLVGTANATLSAEIVVGTTPGGSLGGTWASPTIDDLFLLNSESDTMTGTLTADGYTLGADEVITFGTKTLKYETTRADFILDDDLIIEDTHPGIYIRSTDDNRAYGWHYHPNTEYPLGLWRGQDTGSGIAVSPNTPIIGVDDNNIVYHPQNTYTIQGKLGTSDYDTDPDVKILEIDSSAYPKGIVITDWEVECNEADPTTELSATLNSCDDQGTGAFPGANATTLATLNTTTGNSSASGLGIGVVTDKTLYIIITADPTSDTTLFFVKIKYKRPMN